MEKGKRFKMKVKICRATGFPVEQSDVDSFKAEFARLFDIAQRVCKTDMLRLQKKVAKFENILAKKFPTVIEIDFLATPEQALEAVSKYGNIITAKMRDSDSLLYVIDDAEETRY